MYYLRTKQSFDAAHFLKNYEGKCRNIHGHRWNVVVEIASEYIQEEGANRGMVFDFGDLKAKLKQICEELDHALICEEGALKAKTLEALQEEEFRIVLVPFTPTAENFARYIYQKMKETFQEVCKVAVYETPDNCAMYEE